MVHRGVGLAGYRATQGSITGLRVGPRRGFRRFTRRGMDATSSRLAEDSASLERSRSTTERYLAKLPVVGDLIGSIRDRRKRSQIILATVIAAVVCFFLWFLVLRHMPSSSTAAEE